MPGSCEAEHDGEQDEMPDEQWRRMNEKIEECQKRAWEINPLSKRRILERLDMTKNGAVGYVQVPDGYSRTCAVESSHGAAAGPAA